jgi:thiamine-monophosphate kinase
MGPAAEFDLIRSFLRAGAAERPAGEVLGPGDDCAVVRGRGIALSTDMSVEGVHFRREWLMPEEIGWRATSAALSDLAAVGARPIGVLVSCAVPGDEAGELAPALMAGVRRAVEAVGGAVLGGDLARSPGAIVVDVTVVGECGAPIRRSGASPGEEVWVTGSLGGSAAAVLAFLEGREPVASARERFAHPRPRVMEALWLAERISLTSLIDISDGLGGDAAHLAAASGVAIVLEREAVPVDEESLYPLEGEEALRLAVTGGEDYELCFTSPAGAVEEVRAGFERELGIRLTRVGVVESGAGVFWRHGDGGRVPLGLGGYQHFEESS